MAHIVSSKYSFEAISVFICAKYEIFSVKTSVIIFGNLRLKGQGQEIGHVQFYSWKFKMWQIPDFISQEDLFEVSKISENLKFKGKVQ